MPASLTINDHLASLARGRANRPSRTNLFPDIPNERRLSLLIQYCERMGCFFLHGRFRQVSGCLFRLLRLCALVLFLLLLLLGLTRLLLVTW